MNSNSTTTKSGDRVMQDVHLRDSSGQSISPAKDDTLTNGSQQTKIKEVAPTDTTKTNPSFILTYTGDDLTQIDKIIGGITYRKTLTWAGGKITAVSAWSQV